MTYTWSAALAAPPVALGSRPHAIAADANGRVYVLGGDGTTTRADRYDPATNTWSSVAALPATLGEGAAATDPQDRIVVLDVDNDAIRRYDPATNTWTTLTTVPVANDVFGGGDGLTIDAQGRYWVVRFVNLGAPSSHMFALSVYDPDTNTWDHTPADLTPGYYEGRGIQLVHLDDGRLLLWINHSDTGRLYSYDPVLDQWDRRDLSGAGGPYGGSRPLAKDALGRWHLFGSTAAPKGKIQRIDTTSWARTDVATDASMAGIGVNEGEYATVVGAGGFVYYLKGDGTALYRVLLNATPNAPATTGPADGAALDLTITQRFTWTHSDPDAGDYQTAYDFRYRPVGAVTWTSVYAATAASWRDVPAGTFAEGDYEWQVRTYDHQGTPGPFCTSRFFSAGYAPGSPTITAPTSGGTIAGPTTISWSAAKQDAYQLRRVADNAGSADTATVYYDSGEVVSTAARSRSVTFETNNRYEHIQVRTKLNGLWSSWASIRVNVSYTPPAAPTVSLMALNNEGALWVSISNPTPSGGEPSVEYNSVEVNDGAGWVRKVTNWATSTGWQYYTPVSGRDYSGDVRVTAHASNGTTTTTTVPAGTAPMATDYYGGGYE